MKWYGHRSPRPLGADRVKRVTRPCWNCRRWTSGPCQEGSGSEPEEPVAYTRDTNVLEDDAEVFESVGSVKVSTNQFWVERGRVEAMSSARDERSGGALGGGVVVVGGGGAVPSRRRRGCGRVRRYEGRCRDLGA